MAEISRSIVKHNTFQLIFKLIFHLFITFDFLKSIVIDVELLWELPSTIDFFVLKFIVIEAHSLEMDNEIVWSLSKIRTFCYISFLVAEIALIIGNNLTLDILIESIMNSFIAFYLKGKWIEILISLFNGFAVRANSLTACFTSKSIFKYTFERCFF